MPQPARSCRRRLARSTDRRKPARHRRRPPPHPCLRPGSPAACARGGGGTGPGQPGTHARLDGGKRRAYPGVSWSWGAWRRPPASSGHSRWR